MLPAITSGRAGSQGERAAKTELRTRAPPPLRPAPLQPQPSSTTRCFHRLIHFLENVSMRTGEPEEVRAGQRRYAVVRLDPPTVVSDCHFRKTGTEYDRKPGIKWLSCTEKWQPDITLDPPQRRQI
jgi:hypothetical protein